MSEEIKKFFTTYTDFVTKVTSNPSIELDALKESFDQIEKKSGIKTPRLLTAALGLGSETGEFVEIVKKMFLQVRKYISYEKERRYNVVLGYSVCISWFICMKNCKKNVFTREASIR